MCVYFSLSPKRGDEGKRKPGKQIKSPTNSWEESTRNRRGRGWGTCVNSGREKRVSRSGAAQGLVGRAGLFPLGRDGKAGQKRAADPKRNQKGGEQPRVLGSRGAETGGFGKKISPSSCGATQRGRVAASSLPFPRAPLVFRSRAKPGPSP